MVSKKSAGVGFIADNADYTIRAPGRLNYNGGLPRMQTANAMAFYDLDGTLISSNVVTQYAFFVRKHPSRVAAAIRYAALLASAPALIAIDACSRKAFNRVFYRAYRGMRRDWLLDLAGELFETVVRPAIFPGAKALVEADRARGLRTVLVTGSPDFALGPVASYFGFDDVISNRLLFEDGSATGGIAPPVIAGKEKVTAMLELSRARGAEPSASRAYSDSFSDVSMLEAVGRPSAVNPDRRLKRIARDRGWPVLDLKHGNDRSE
jgi:HAD superfamily hydrolase (TIGR01490 family)